MPRQPSFSKRITKLRDQLIEQYLPLVHTRVAKLQAYNTQLSSKLAERPPDDTLHQTMGLMAQPRTPLRYEVMASAYDQCSVLKRCVVALREEVFRNGIEIQPKFEWKCEVCGQEYDHKPEDGDCDNMIEETDQLGITYERECAGRLRQPDETEKIRLESFLENVNANHQDIITLFKMLEDDLNKYDDCWLLMMQEYEQNEDGYITGRQLKEIVRGPPRFMRWAISNKRGELGGSEFLCLQHRNQVEGQGGRCKTCNRGLFKVIAYSTGIGTDLPDKRYVEGEVYHACYDEATEVLTDKGWRYFPQLDGSELIASLNKGRFMYTKPLRMFEYDYEGELIGFKARSIDLLVTPNHRMFVKKQHGKEFEFIQADKMTGYSYSFKRNCLWEGEEKEYFNLPSIDTKDALGILDKHWENIKIPMDLWVEFLGYFISEGSTTHDIKNSCYHIGIGQSKDANPEKYEKIRYCLEKISSRWYSNDIGFGLTNKQLSSYLSVFGKAHEKFIPDEFKSLSQRQLRILLNALLLGDGSITYKKDGMSAYCTYYTTSRRLADDVQEIAIKAGYGANITERTPPLDTVIKGKEVHFRDSLRNYVVSITGYLNESRDTNTPELQIKKSKYLQYYSGKVYCAEVPSGVILVRRNGKTCWCGNSKYSPSNLYGYPPIATLWDQILTIIYMLNYMHNAYDKQRMPAQILAVKTRNEKSLEAQVEGWKQKVRTDPHAIGTVAVDPDSGEGGVEVVRFSDKIKEMEFAQVRAEISQEFGAFYGVSPVFMGDVSASGGLNNEGLQIAVTNRAVESSQKTYDNVFLPAVCAKLGVEDWEAVLLPSEEQDEMHDLQLRAQEILNAQSMKNIGFDVDMDDDGTFKFKKTTQPTTMPSALTAQPPDTLTASGMPEQVQRTKKKIVKADDIERLEKEYWNEAVNAFSENIWPDAFSDLTQPESDLVKRILRQAFLSADTSSMFNPQKIIAQLTSKTTLTPERAEMIVRTEQQAVANKAREMAYEKRDDGTFKYQWLVHKDSRTSELCKRIEARVGEGKTMAELKTILKEESLKENGSNWQYRDFTPHINCRSRVARVV